MKRRLLIGIIFLYVSCLASSVYATEVKIDTVSKEVNPGETVTVKLSINNIDTEEGSNAIQGRLKYDKEIFEKVENQNISFLNNWSMAYNDEDTESEGKFIILKLLPSVKEDEDMIEIKLKAKQDIKRTKTSIELQELCTVDKDEIIKMDDSKVVLNVKGKFSLKTMFLEWIEKVFMR